MSLSDNIPTIDYSKYSCTMYLNGAALSSYYQLISVQVKQGFQHITSAQISIKQGVGFEDSIIPDPFSNPPLAGEEITIKASFYGDEIVLFEGVIVKHKFKNSARGTRLDLTAKNKVVAMAMTTKTEIFAKETDKTTIETVCQNSDISLNLDENVGAQLSIMHTQSVKHQINDWDFVNLKAEANSCFLYTENETVQVVLPKLDSSFTEIHTAKYGENIFEIEIEQDDRVNNIENEIISFDLSTLESYVTSSEDFGSIAGQVKIKGVENAINYRTFDEQEAQSLLDARNQLKNISIQNGLVHIHANLKPKPGDTVQINGFNSFTDNNYIITSVMQDFSDGGFSTYLQFGLNQESFASKFHCETAKKAPLMLSGIVQQIENDPDNLFRILVHIPAWKDAQEGVWARHTTVYAGQDYGMVILPEVGDEVLLSFIGNDFDSPLIIGSVFNPSTPPFANFEDNNYTKAFITKKGMKWTWDDNKGIHEISTPNGNKILMSEDKNSVTIEDENGNKIEMAKTEINIESQSSLNLKAATQLKIEAASIEISASGTNTIKGGLVQIN